MGTGIEGGDPTAEQAIADAAAASAATDAAATPTLTGPWANDLAVAFADPAQQAAVDQFLREKVQPYVTRLETSTRGLEDAQALYNDLTTDPGNTFLAIAEELFGEEGTSAIVAVLQSGEAEVTKDGDVVAVKDSALAADDIEALNWIKEQRDAKLYDDALSTFKSAGHDDIVDKYFHNFVAIAGGDLDAAYRGYQEFMKDFTPATPATEPTAEEAAAAAALAAAPTTLGGATTASTTVPPVEVKPKNLDEALDLFFNGQKVAPPTVGAV